MRHLSYSNVMSTVAAVAAIGGGTFAIAAVPDKSGKINACYVKSGKRKGQVRLLVTGTKCGRGEAKIAWNQQGLPGGQGPAGADGQPGAQGAPGSDAQFNGAAAGGDLTGTYPAPKLATLESLSMTAGGIVNFGAESMSVNAINSNFVFTDDIQTSDFVLSGQDMRVGDASGTDDDSLSFDANAEDLTWLNSAQQFELTDDLDVAGHLEVSGFLETFRQNEPAAGGSTSARIYARNNGSDRTQLMVKFGSSTPIVLATQP